MINQSELNKKLRQHYKDFVVNKKLTQIHEISRLPRFVSESLLIKLSDLEDDKEKLKQALEDIVEKVTSLYPEPRDKDKILHLLFETNKYSLIDEVKVYVDEYTGIKKAIIPILNIKDAKILESIVNENLNLLSTGIWGVMGLTISEPIKDENENPVTSPVTIEKFKPIQAPNISLNEFVEKRRHFSLEEWIDILINTLGRNPETLTERQKLILISKLIPLVEGNVNMMEFGPKATGKTYLYRNISFYTHIISGGTISPAALFYNIGTKVFGHIGVRDSVIFDEVMKVRFINPDDMMGKLKDYMESGHFERGPKKARATCSLVFMGNVQVEKYEDGYIPIEDLFYVLPDIMRDTAFIDRINGLIPGWELPKIKDPRHLSSNYGFSTDYFSEILHSLRNLSFQTELKNKIEIENIISIRDIASVFKLASGFMKLLFPHKNYTEKELRDVLDFVLGYRQQVMDWLNKVEPGEFEKKKMTYQI